MGLVGGIVELVELVELVVVELVALAAAAVVVVVVVLTTAGGGGADFHVKQILDSQSMSRKHPPLNLTEYGGIVVVVVVVVVGGIVVAFVEFEGIVVAFVEFAGVVCAAHSSKLAAISTRATAAADLRAKRAMAGIVSLSLCTSYGKKAGSLRRGCLCESPSRAQQETS